MPFTFRVELASHLAVAGIWCLDGMLETGEVNAPAQACAETARGSIPIYVRTVAFVESKAISANRLTLVVDQPPCDLSELTGATLRSVD